MFELITDFVGQIGVYPRRPKLRTTSSLATISAPGFLNASNLNGTKIYETDIIDVIYNYNPVTGHGVCVMMQPVFSSTGVITLTLAAYNATWYDVTVSASALASAATVTIVPSVDSQQFIIREIRVNYSAAGLSGGGGDRLLSITDGTNVWNGTGITAALLGTPTNVRWGNAGNPVPANIPFNQYSVAGRPIYAQYIGGTTDYTTGSVVISLLAQRVA